MSDYNVKQDRDFASLVILIAIIVVVTVVLAFFGYYAHKSDAAYNYTSSSATEISESER